MIRLRKNKNTIEAYACSCTPICYGCVSTCNPSNCGCDEVYFNNPFSGITFNETGDNTSSIASDMSPPEWQNHK
jgi:putative bacteriocin precursor